MKKSNFIGTSKLLKLAWRRDRMKIALWILAIFFLTLLMTAANGTLSPEEMKNIGTVAIENPGMRLMVAPTNENLLHQLGPFILFRMSFLLTLALALLNIHMVIRHTRQNEETGRWELIASTVCGKKAPIASTLLLSIGVNLAVFIALSFSLIINQLDFKSSLLAGLSYGLYGFFFSCLTLLGAQLTSTSKGASGFSTLALGCFFLLNGMGNVFSFGEHFLTWLTPIGWVQHIRPFDHNQVAPLFLIIVFSVIFWHVSNEICLRRDVGAGIIPVKMGRENGKSWYLNLGGFALKLQKNFIISWTISIFLFSIIFTAAAQGYGDTLTDSELLKDALQGQEDSFIYMMIVVFNLLICFFTIPAYFKLRTEEFHGLSENILATPVKRKNYLFSHYMISLMGTIGLTLIFGLILYLSLEDQNHFSQYFYFLFQNLSGNMLLLGLGTCFYGFIPQYAQIITWGLTGLFMLTGQFFGSLLQLSENLQKLSPFAFFGFSYAQENWVYAISFYFLAFILSTMGIYRYVQRDLHFQNR